MESKILEKIGVLCKYKAEMYGNLCVGLSFNDPSWPFESSLRNNPKKHEVVKLALQIKSLRSLNLRKARLGFLPNVHLESLVDLDLSCNSLDFLPEFCFGDNLRKLNLGSNFLTNLNFLPEKLEVLKIHKNKIEKLPDLPKTLKVLNLYLNPHKDIQRLNLPALEYFSFGGIGYRELPELPKNLKWLCCVGNEIKFLPEYICNFKELQGMRLAKNKLEYLPENIGQLHKLKEITVYKNNLADLPKSFFDLRLDKLNLAENRLKQTLKKKICSHFQECSFLRL